MSGEAHLPLRAQVLDATSLIATGHLDLKEVAFFLTQPNSLPPNVALSIFVSTGEMGGSRFWGVSRKDWG